MRKNFYHKPIASLNWESKLSPSQTLSVTAYASYGRGGGTGDLGHPAVYFKIDKNKEVVCNYCNKKFIKKD